MNLQELMIGDWVMCNGTPLKLNIGQIHNLVCDSKWAHTYKCEPIPLTAEILKANEWKFYMTAWYWNRKVCVPTATHEEFIRENTLPFMVCIDDPLISHDVLGSDDYYERVILYINYVHELQHALRLCGRHKLADNFKIAALES